MNEIIVTARRRSERLQDVPIAISVLNGQDLVRESITRTDDLRTKVPGLSIQNASFGNTTAIMGIRGQYQKSPVGVFDQSVSSYLDEVVIARAAGIIASLYDLDSVQVLKGPQGTLFGRNATGGAVLFTTTKPTTAFEGHARATLGDYAQRTLEGAVNIPMSDAVQLRLAGQWSRHRGYTRNINTGSRLDDDKSLGLRAALRFKPNDAFENNLVVNYVDQTPKGVAYRLVFTYPTAGGASAAPTLATLNSRSAHTVSTSDSRTKSKVLAIIENATWNITSNTSLKTILGYVKTNAEFFVDYDGTPLSILSNTAGTHFKQYTVEPQLNGVFGNLTWTAGLFYFEEKGFDHTDTISGTTTRLSGADIVNKSYAAYAQGTYRIPGVETVSVTAGVRETKDKRSIVAHNFIQTPASTTCRLTVTNSAPAVLSVCSGAYRTSHSEPTYTLSLDWKAMPDLLLYGTTRRGYRSGGFQYSGTRPADFDPSLPETVTDYEAGFKFQWRNGDSGGRFNVAAFRSRYKNVQKSVTRPLVENGVAFISSLTTNAASATVTGIEADLSWDANRYVTLTAFGSAIRPKYGRFITPDGIDRSANAFGNTPKKSYGGSLELHSDETERGQFALRADVFHQSLTYITDFNTDINTRLPLPQDQMPGYTLVNARLDWRDIQGTGLDAGLFVRNLFDKDYFVGGIDLGAASGAVAKNLGPPRTFGVEVSKRF